MMYWMIGLAGMLGALLRYYIGLFIPSGELYGFPLGTLIVNFIGCFLLSWFTVWSMQRKSIPSWFRMGFATGFIGAFTTFSTFSVEVVKMLDHGLWIMGFFYLFLSLWGGLFLAWIGYKMAMKQGEKNRLEGGYS
ncbi:CrcB protein [Thermoactinomyces sp. DSM 45891]|uniref:fluoride efflux transporter CrcB n=1 Tax=Thermoactinomyces sp. DSM 45891 TaxID=1761907 RepID=UPI00091CE10E|nr:fluoride efflux transporter CrcB [Thermoactinomyces sp. DSM 45891]SFX55726.1 CrcB protein [Thermoactinomyces sp. DSM 45891]